MKVKKAKADAKKVVKKIVIKLRKIKAAIVKAHKPAPKKLILKLKLHLKKAKKTVKVVVHKLVKAKLVKKAVKKHALKVKKTCIAIKACPCKLAKKFKKMAKRANGKQHQERPRVRESPRKSRLLRKCARSMQVR